MTEEAPLNLAVVRELLLNSFTELDLRIFCRDHPEFAGLVYRFSRSDGLEALVEYVMGWCQEKDLFPRLLTGVQKANPSQYERFCARLHSPAPEVPGIGNSTESSTPDSDVLSLTKTLMRDAREAYDSGSYSKAIELLTERVQLDPDSPPALGLLGKSLARAGQFREAIPVLTQAIALTQPNRAYYLHERGFCHVMLGEYGPAINDFGEALKVRELTSTLRWRAIAYFHLGGLDIALKDLDRAIEIKPLYLCGHVTRGVVLFRCGRFEDASEELRRCEALTLRDADDFYCLAELYACFGRLDEARVKLRIALEREPKLRARVRNNPLIAELAHDPDFDASLRLWQA